MGFRPADGNRAPQSVAAGDFEVFHDLLLPFVALPCSPGCIALRDFGWHEPRRARDPGWHGQATQPARSDAAHYRVPQDYGTAALRLAVAPATRVGRGTRNSRWRHRQTTARLWAAGLEHEDSIVPEHSILHCLTMY